MAKPAPALERPLPHNLDAERSVLGAILLTLDNAYITQAAAALHSGDFFDVRHQAVFHSMLSLKEQSKPIDPVMLKTELEATNKLEFAGGAAYIDELTLGVPRVVNLPFYMGIVKEKALLRQAIHMAHAVQESAFDPSATAADVLNRLRTAAEKDIAHVNGNGHKLFAAYSLGDFLVASFPPKEHLIQAITPRNGRIMVVALPHRLKSWFTTALSLQAGAPGKAFGQLEIYKPVRTYLAQLEDWPGELQARLQSLVLKRQFSECDPSNVRILPRCGLDLTRDDHLAFLTDELKEFRADHVILDVLRKFFSGDVNSPKETAAFLARLDRLQDTVQCAITLIHHENRKKEELMLAAAGSYNWSGWAEVMIHFSRKTEAKTENGPITSVEIEIDSKVGPPIEPMRLVLDMNLANPLRLEALEDGTGFHEAMKQLAPQGWTVDNLANVLEVHRRNAWRRIEAWEKSGKIEKIKTGKRGPHGGLAVWHSLDPIDSL